MVLKKKDEKKSVFNVIAPIYGLFYNYQKKHYKHILSCLEKEFNVSRYENIIDIGCGTGALCAVLSQSGFKVTGVDTAQKMLDIASNKEENKSIQFMQASAVERLPFEDNHFDLAITSFVAHGLKPNERKVLYTEMSRITKHLVIIYDYNQKKSLFISMIEWLEHGDYFNFIKIVKHELREHFRDIQVIDSNKHASWYICTPRKK